MELKKIKTGPLPEHIHRFPPVYEDGVERLIIGTFPTREFTDPDILPGADGFYYGSANNLFWSFIQSAFDEKIRISSVEEKKRLLLSHKTGLIDIVSRACRIRNCNKDSNLLITEYNDIVSFIVTNTAISILYFTSRECFMFFCDFFSDRIKSLPGRKRSSEHIYRIKISEYVKIIWGVILPTPANYRPSDITWKSDLFRKYLNISPEELEHEFRRNKAVRSSQER